MVDHSTPKEQVMKAKEVQIGQEFYTNYASIEHCKPLSNVHRWKMIAPEHRLAQLVLVTGDVCDHTRIIDEKEEVFATAGEAWQDCATQLNAIIEKIREAVKDCESKVPRQCKESA
jgi:hypothetical protein